MHSCLEFGVIGRSKSLDFSFQYSSLAYAINSFETIYVYVSFQERVWSQGFVNII